MKYKLLKSYKLHYLEKEHNMKKFCTFILFLLLPALLLAQSAADLIKEGDELAAKFENQKALEKYLEADKVSPSNWEVCWRVSRTYVDIAEHMPSSNSKEEEAQLELYEKAFNYADKAVKLAPDKTITNLRRAISNGRIALFKGVFSAAGIVNDVKKDVDRAIQLNNGGTENLATAHYILGRTHAKLSEKSSVFRWPLGLSWGDIDDAIKNYQRAIQLRPTFIMYHLDLARAYVAEDEYQKAREHLNKIPTLPIQDEDDQKFIAESKQLLQEIKNKK
jgi:tetratricopeptide (TPR) repeat protein